MYNTLLRITNQLEIHKDNLPESNHKNILTDIVLQFKELLADRPEPLEAQTFYYYSRLIEFVNIHNVEVIAIVSANNKTEAATLFYRQAKPKKL